MKKLLWIPVAIALTTGTLSGQEIMGDWQGMLTAPKEERVIVHIRKELDGSAQVRMVLIDRRVADWGAGAQANRVSREGADVRFAFDAVKGTFEGKISADGNWIRGTWSQGNTGPLDLRRVTTETAWRDPVPHQSRLVTVDKDVSLEVIDWGGSGPPLVLLAGLGNTAHVFDSLAPKLTDRYRVYGITRRGFGASSTPASGYSADRLGDDVMEVVSSLRLDRPVVVGHSVAGQELSSIGSRYPEKLAGLVYLEAGYAYAFYDPTKSCALPSAPPGNPTTVTAAIQVAAVQTATRQAEFGRSTEIKTPVLAVYADTPGNATCAKAFERAVPSSRIVRVPGATHYVFGSHEAEVLKEIQHFSGRLKQ